ncbi:MAG: SUMF1/EgtB/PvdO family nonheme iron enzyme [Rikenellaceae bacterium]
MKKIKSILIMLLLLPLFVACEVTTETERITIENYVVTFDANGGDGNMPYQFFREECSTPLNTNILTCEGHIFVGWSSEPSGDVEYEDRANYTATQHTTLFAVWQQIDISPEMIFVEGGTFTMGCDDTVNAGSGGTFNDEAPAHSVTLDPFYIGNYEVTQREWQEVMGSNPSYFIGETLPVDRVTWYDTIEYCNARSAKEGFAPYYTIDKTTADPDNINSTDKLKWLITLNPTSDGYRLPTEAEWEWAAIGGVKSEEHPYAGSDNINEIAWYATNANNTTHSVGGKLPNELGIYDMSGNVWEWCWDWYGDYTAESQTNPTGPTSGYFRCVRSGSWLIVESFCRNVNRDRDDPIDKYYNMGLRVVRSAK